MRWPTGFFSQKGKAGLTGIPSSIRPELGPNASQALLRKPLTHVK
jgi:hypothetical protein